MKNTDTETLLRNLTGYVIGHAGRTPEERHRAVNILKDELGFTDNDISRYVDDRDLLFDCFIEDLTPESVEMEDKFRNLYEDGIITDGDFEGSISDMVEKYRNYMFPYICDVLRTDRSARREVMRNAEELFEQGQTENETCFELGLFHYDRLYVNALTFARNTEKLYEDSLRLVHAMNIGKFDMDYENEELEMAM